MVGATGVSTGAGGGPDPHGRAERSGVNSSRPLRGGRGELNSPAGAVPTQNGEASGLAPEVLHEACGFEDVGGLEHPDGDPERLRFLAYRREK